MRTNNGAIQISRSIYDSEIWIKPPEWLKIWIYILGRVNFSDNSLYKRGENYFNYEIIALECGVKYKTVVNCVKFLKDRKQIEVKKTTRGVNLKVKNYDEYQTINNYKGRQKEDRRKTEGRQKEDKGNTITEEGKEGKNEIYIGANRSEVLQELNNFIEYWNKNFDIQRKVTHKLEEEYLKIRKKYPKDDMALSLQRYIEKKKDGPKEYELTPITFLIQKNGFISYL